MMYISMMKSRMLIDALFIFWTKCIVKNAKSNNKNLLNLKLSIFFIGRVVMHAMKIPLQFFSFKKELDLHVF
jgi:hypothetical protein